VEETTVFVNKVWCNASPDGNAEIKFVSEDGRQQRFSLSKVTALDVAFDISSMCDRLTELEGQSPYIPLTICCAATNPTTILIVI